MGDFWNIMMTNWIKYLSLSLIYLFVCAETSAQDLLARQAPIDVKLKAVDSLALTKYIRAEQSLFPADDIYPNWTNASVNSYGNVALPDSCVFDLTDFAMPTTNTRITDIFGYRPRRRRLHNGLDVKVYIGDTIRSAFSGKVRIVKDQGRRRGYGKYIVIRHDNGLETVYGHLSKQLVKEEQLVKAGEPIGLGGNTGRSTGSHLHFETRFLGVALDPAKMFDFEKQDILADTYTYRKKQTKTPSGGDIYYKVRKGDTLGKIAARQGVTVSQLCKLNGITRKSILRVGQVLRCI